MKTPIPEGNLETKPTIEEIHRIQYYLRENARNQYESVSLPPFTLFFHPSSTVKYFNYAIPDVPTDGGGEDVLAELRRLFHSRERTPRFEFFEAFTPALPDTLLRHGFVEEARQWSMICTSDGLCPPPAVPGLEIIPLTSESPAEDVRDYLLAQRQGFNPTDTSEPNHNDLVQARLDFIVSGWHSFLGRYHGEAAASATFGRPIDGVTEIAGIATREAFRRMGIASFITHVATLTAFEHGVETAMLTAGSEAAGRVYGRLGFRPFSTMLAYIDSDAAP